MDGTRRDREEWVRHGVGERESRPLRRSTVTVHARQSIFTCFIGESEGTGMRQPVVYVLFVFTDFEAHGYINQGNDSELHVGAVSPVFRKHQGQRGGACDGNTRDRGWRGVVRELQIWFKGRARQRWETVVPSRLVFKRGEPSLPVQCEDVGGDAGPSQCVYIKVIKIIK